MAYIDAYQWLNQTNGTVQITTKGFYSAISTERLGYDPIANFSRVRFKLLHGVANTSYTHEGTCYDTFLRIDWTTYSKANFNLDCNPWSGSGNPALVHEVTVDLYHDSNGNKTVDIWGRFRAQTTYGPGDCYVVNSGAAFNVGLPQIDRAGFTFNSFYVDTMTTTGCKFKYTTSLGIDWIQYSLNGGGWVDGGDEFLRNLSPNTTYSLKLRGRRAYNQVWSESGTINFTTHPTTVQIVNPTVTDITPFGCTLSLGSTSTANTRSSFLNILAPDGVEDTVVYEENIPAVYSRVVTGLFPDVNYVAQFELTTVRSGVSSTIIQVPFTTPSDAYCRIIEADGTTGDKKKMYLITPEGVTTEVKKEQITIL